MEWMLLPLKRYAEFSGRSRRMEFWMYALLSFIVYMIAYGLIVAGGGLSLLLASRARALGGAQSELTNVVPGPLFWAGVALACLWLLATLIPTIAVTVRRLHDRDMTGWWYLGFIVAIVVLGRIGIVGSLVTLLLEIVWLVVMALPGTSGANRYGDDPLGNFDPEVFA
jgi:uncharacterized membrane protein YhaH (DUF805 family)